MPFKILYVTATSEEADGLSEIKGMVSFPGGYRFNDCDINVLVTGVGSIATSWVMKQWISVNEKPDLAINAGIAGSYNDELIIGDVVMPFSDCFADAGIEDGDNFLTLHDAGLIDANEFPFRDGLLIAENKNVDKFKNLLRPVSAITVNAATGSEATRDKLLKRFNPDIETMEGAAFFYICTMEKIPFLAIRAISNRVELRNRSNWNIELALNKLSEKLREILLILE
jgi:futalosine hydrolase